MTSKLGRRRFLQYAAGTFALSLAGCKGESATSPEEILSMAKPRKGPRYVIQLMLSGGHDPVYTTDPKERSEVDADIDLPAENKIVEAAGLRLGPHFSRLEKHANKLAFLNGVQVGTANHDTGIKQFSRLKTRARDTMPGVLDVIGSARDEQPLGVAYLQAFFRVLHSPKYMGTSDAFYFGPDNIFDQAAKHQTDARAVAAKLRDQARRLGGKGATSAQLVTKDNLLQSAGFLERVPDLPALSPTGNYSDYTAQAMSDSFDRALWLIENDLTRCVFLDLGLLGWDTHIRNAPRQQRMNHAFVDNLMRFIKQLEERSNAHGKLYDNSLILAGSDIGRFPKLNDMEGKDHLPQTSFFFAGQGIKGGQVNGQTDGHMEALPMSLKTGKTDKGGKHILVDDVGTTLLHLTGFDPMQFGYAGELIECLLA